MTLFNSQLPADASKLRNSAAYLRNNFQALELYLGADNLASGQPMQVFPPGTKMWFYQDVAPPGWASVTTLNDCLVGVKGASGSTYATGGTTAGTWQLPNHTLSVDEMPSHNHNYLTWPHYPPQPGERTHQVKDFDYAKAYRYEPTTNVGGNQPHNHGSGWRPQAAVGIIAVKT